MSNRPVAKVRAAQKQATRERLLRIAEREFTKHGFDKVGVDDICRKARLTHGALYHHFPGKTELFQAVVERLTRALAARVAEAAAAHSGWAQVEAACDAYLDGCADPAVQALLYRDGPRVLCERFDEIDHSANEPMVVGLIEHWIAQELLRPLPVAPVARMLGAAFAEAAAALGSHPDAALRSQLTQVLHAWLRTLQPARPP